MKPLIILIVLSLTGTATLPAQTNPEKPYRYMAWSLLVPGSGEYILGYPSHTRYLLLTEAALILGAWSLNEYSDITLDKAITYAGENAGISGQTRTRKFLLALGNYRSVSEYNSAMRLQRTPSDQFPENDPAYAWEWKSDSDRSTFRRNRQKADELNYSVQFVVGAIVINHAISAFNVLRLIRTSGKPVTTSQADSDLDFLAMPADPFTGRIGSGIDFQLRLSW